MPEFTASLLPADADLEGWGKPRRPLPPEPRGAAGVQAGDVPDALLPPPVDPAVLVKVGEVCGFEIHADKKTVDLAAKFGEQLGKDRWPHDALLATIMALRLGARMSYREIAVALNMSERHVLRVAKKGKKEVQAEREISRLDREGLPMAVENVLEGLETKDKDYTLEYLKGRGVFTKTHTGNESGGTVAAANIGLVVRFEHTGQVSEIRAGAIIASPNNIQKAIENAPNT